jgi:phosphohistidine phosphatase
MAVLELYLIRHGIAAERGDEYPDDSKRPLTSAGMSKLREVAKGLNELDVSFNVIISSPLVRTRQTAEIVAGTLKEKPQVVTSDALAPAGTPAGVVQELARHAKHARIALVGHEPNLGELAARLIGAKSAIERDGAAPVVPPAASPAQTRRLTAVLSSEFHPHSASCRLRLLRIERVFRGGTLVANSLIQRKHRGRIAHGRILSDFKSVAELVADEGDEFNGREISAHLNPEIALLSGRQKQQAPSQRRRELRHALDVDDHIRCVECCDEFRKRLRSVDPLLQQTDDVAIRRTHAPIGR